MSTWMSAKFRQFGQTGQLDESEWQVDCLFLALGQLHHYSSPYTLSCPWTLSSSAHCTDLVVYKQTDRLFGYHQICAMCTATQCSRTTSVYGELQPLGNVRVKSHDSWLLTRDGDFWKKSQSQKSSSDDSTIKSHRSSQSLLLKVSLKNGVRETT